MKLQIENFGPIKKGEIDLDKRFYTFVGYNNSGKTYMSQFLWEFIQPEDFGEIMPLKENNGTFEITETFVNKVLENHKELFIAYRLYMSFNVSKEHFLNKNFSLELSGIALEKIKKKKVTLLLHIVDYNKYNGTEYILFKKAKNSLSILIEKYQSKPEIIKDDGISISYGVPLTSIIGTSPEMDRYDVDIEKPIRDIIWKALGFETQFNCQFLPATRTFFPTYYKEIYQVAKDAITLINEEYRLNPNSSKLKDLIKPNATKATEFLVNKIFRSKYIETNFYTDLVEDLEKIMGGKITTRQAEGLAPVEFQFEMNDSEKSTLDMYLASSSINQLTTLYLYLKYWANESNNFLFIDEPEENLHPKNQIALVNLLMKFANQNNNRVLVSTHSSFIAEMINNYAQIAYLQEEGKDVKEIIDKNKLDIQPIKNLKHTDFGVYFFNGETMREYPVEEYGAFFRDFQQETDKVKEITDYLNEAVFQSLYEQKNQKEDAELS